MPWKKRQIEKLRGEMLTKIPIVMFNSPKNIYSLEQVIQDLL